MPPRPKNLSITNQISLFPHTVSAKQQISHANQDKTLTTVLSHEADIGFQIQMSLQHTKLLITKIPRLERSSLST